MNRNFTVPYHRDSTDIAAAANHHSNIIAYRIRFCNFDFKIISNLLNFVNVLCLIPLQFFLFFRKFQFADRDLVGNPFFQFILRKFLHVLP